jgi:hypothetical protein
VHFIEEVAGEGLQAKRVAAHGKGLAQAAPRSDER